MEREYIEREKIKKAIAEIYGEEAVRVVSRVPKADVESVRHGEWLPVDDENDAFDCSECPAMVRKKTNYCPRCGAKMDNGSPKEKCTHVETENGEFVRLYMADDSIRIYVQERSDSVLVSDEGYTLSELEEQGQGILSLTSKKAFLNKILDDYGIKLDGNRLCVTAKPEEFYKKQEALVQAIISIRNAFGARELTIKDLAQRLNGRQYGEELSSREVCEARDRGFVVVYGYSDDNVEFNGAITDEVGAWGGAEIYFNEKGILPEPHCDCDECPYYEAAKEVAYNIVATRDAEKGNGSVWRFYTEIPHETFCIYEDDRLFGEGIVFDIESLKI